MWSCIANVVVLMFIFPFFAKVRLSGSITDDVDEDPTGNKALWDRGLLNGASQKAGIVANFHVGEICMSLQVILSSTYNIRLILLSWNWSRDSIFLFLFMVVLLKYWIVVKGVAATGMQYVSAVGIGFCKLYRVFQKELYNMLKDYFKTW
jgi:hypothetical protein